MHLKDLAPLIQARRQALGLSQGRLAKLCGLSRATINQLENGSLVDLGAAKLLALLQLLNIEINAQERPAKANALALLSQTASVSYKRSLKPAELSQALAQGTLPEAIAPHIASLLDLSHSMGIQTVIEGVETPDELAALVELGADLMQGFNFASPGVAFPTVDAAAFELRRAAR
jgi:transcriptional regulator with XRE-family HTH domain